MKRQQAAVDQLVDVHLQRAGDLVIHDGRAVLVRREEFEPHRLHARARGASEAHVALERGLEPVLQDDAERNVDAEEE